MSENEIQAAAANVQNPEADVRRWMLEKKNATLCTLSTHASVSGFPFGSVVPFALTPKGQPVVLIANIAAHTRNLKADPRASLFVHEQRRDGDPQSGWRITLMGSFERLTTDAEQSDAQLVTQSELDEIDARYRQRVPSAKVYLATHGFDYWRMSSFDAVRYIAGFGKICWADAKGVFAEEDEEFTAMKTGAITHMNKDHQDALKLYCQAQTGIAPQSAEMISLNCDGFLVRTQGPDDLRFIPFGHEVQASEVRPEVVRLVKEARAHLASSQ